MQRIELDDVDPTNSLEYMLNGEIFTGEVVETGPNGELLELTTVVDGLPHGPSRSWYPDGTLMSEEMVFRGRATGISRDWHANGNLAKESKFDDDGNLLSFKRWADDGSELSDD